MIGEQLGHKRAFNLLCGVNQGCGLLLARGLEKREPVALVNTLEKIECSHTSVLHSISVFDARSVCSLASRVVQGEQAGTEARSYLD